MQVSEAWRFTKPQCLKGFENGAASHRTKCAGRGCLMILPLSARAVDYVSFLNVIYNILLVFSVLTRRNENVNILLSIAFRSRVIKGL